jgi:endonuclease/exonuclease/phosphatase (EEP) superfamily protein YafD
MPPPGTVPALPLSACTMLRSIRLRVFATGLAIVSTCLPGCVTLTVQPRAVLLDSEGKVEVQSLACTGPAFVERRTRGMERAEALDPTAIRILTWNVHKQDDPGWDRDLTQFAAQHDVVLLQEAVLTEPLRRIVEGAGLRWVMASSFIYSDIDIGVITSSRKIPLASCTQRAVEPLIRIPKSAVISWFRLEGREDTLAVVNVHAINFAITLGAYQAQMEALAEALADHPGPIIFAGDLNTWNQIRNDVVRDVGKKLKLTEIEYKDDKRTLFMGKQLDHILVRGLDLVEGQAIEVKSSDHNPVRATFRVSAAPAAPAR